MTGYGSSIHSFGYIMVSLLIACMYVIYDTQMIIERCETYGERDVPKHTMILFLDLFDLFIKIVQVLLELQAQDEKKKKNKK
jgi:FtsH-binding integral membrane protein